jgi:hypothetical protein
MVKNPNNLSTLPLKSASFKYLYHSGPFHSCKHPLPLDMVTLPIPPLTTLSAPPHPHPFSHPFKHDRRYIASYICPGHIYIMKVGLIMISFHVTSWPGRENELAPITNIKGQYHAKLRWCFSADLHDFPFYKT